MPYPLPLTRTEAYLAYKAGVIQQSDLKPSLAVPRNGIDAWLAYWTGLAADYPKREDGTPHILQEEEAYIAYLCGVINEYPEKCLRRVGAYLRYLISARWGRPDHPLNREELYLSLIKTQFIPSGDPSSDIEIDGTAKAAFVDVKMYGDTFQQTYTGKNILKFVASTGGLNGLTVTTNEATGVVTVSGTPTANWANIQSTTATMSLAAGTYVLSISKANPNYRLNFRIYDSSFSGGYKDFQSADGGSSVVITLDSDITNQIMRIYIDHNYDLVPVNWSFIPMLEVGGTPTTPFEPFVGGQPSPNPDYPQAVQAVTGLQTVEVAGKNLLNVNGIVLGGGYEGLTVQLVNKDESTGTIGIRLTGNVASNLWSIYVRTNDIQLDPNTTYTLSRSFSESGGLRNAGGIRIRIGSSYTVTTTDASTTFTTDSTGIIQVLLYAAYNQQGPTSDIDSTVIFNNLLLEEGSTVTAFAPYSRHTHEINLGKNLFDVEKTPWISKVAYDASGNRVNWNGYVGIAEYQPVEPETTYSFSNSTGKGIYYGLVFYDKDKTKISNITASTRTFTTPQNCKFIRFAIGSGVTEKPTWTQLELGSTVTAYAAYFEPIELCKIGTYQDYIWKDGGDWKVHRANGYYALTDSVSITPSIDTNQPNTTRFQFTNILAEPSSTSGRSNLKCSHFKYASMWNTDVVGIQTADYAQESSNTRFWFRIPKTIATTFNQLKSWLANNTVELYYPLATATDTIITNQALIDQLEALVKGGSEEGTTYIKLSTPEPNLPGLLYVEAAKYV